jgi:hypothetical protein
MVDSFKGRLVLSQNTLDKTNTKNALLPSYHLGLDTSIKVMSCIRIERFRLNPYATRSPQYVGN